MSPSATLGRIALLRRTGPLHNDRVVSSVPSQLIPMGNWGFIPLMMWIPARPLSAHTNCLWASSHSTRHFFCRDFSSSSIVMVLWKGGRRTHSTNPPMQMTQNGSTLNKHNYTLYDKKKRFLRSITVTHDATLESPRAWFLINRCGCLQMKASLFALETKYQVSSTFSAKAGTPPSQPAGGSRPDAASAAGPGWCERCAGRGCRASGSSRRFS